jgi:hypothetical protein
MISVYMVGCIALSPSKTGVDAAVKEHARTVLTRY